MKQVENLLHPVDIDHAWLGLDRAPGKFPDADKINAQFPHLGDVGWPVGGIPMFGEIADSKLAARHCVHRGSQSRCATNISSVIALI